MRDRARHKTYRGLALAIGAAFSGNRPDNNVQTGWFARKKAGMMGRKRGKTVDSSCLDEKKDKR
jgi:hypothetical protein